MHLTQLESNYRDSVHHSGWGGCENYSYCKPGGMNYEQPYIPRPAKVLNFINDSKNRFPEEYGNWISE